MAQQTFSNEARGGGTFFQGNRFQAQGNINFFFLANENVKTVKDNKVFGAVQEDLQADSEELLDLSLILHRFDINGPHPNAEDRAKLSQIEESCNRSFKEVRNKATGLARSQTEAFERAEIRTLERNLKSHVKSFYDVLDQIKLSKADLHKIIDAWFESQLDSNDKASTMSVAKESVNSLSGTDEAAIAELRKSLARFGITGSNFERLKNEIIEILRSKAADDQVDSDAPSRPSSIPLLAPERSRSRDIKGMMHRITTRALRRLSPQELMSEACSKGILAEVHKARSAGANINAIDAIGRTPLIAAIDNNKIDIIDYLLCNGTDVELADNPKAPQLKRTPVIAAIDKGLPEILTMLLSHNASPSGMSGEFMGAPLDLAVAKDDFVCAEILLEKGADPNLKLHRDSLVDQVVSLNKHAMLTLLLKHGARITDSVPQEQDSERDSRGITSGQARSTLEHAMEHHHPETLKVLLGQMNLVSVHQVDDLRLLFRAVSCGWLDYARLLFDYGADPRLSSVHCCSRGTVCFLTDGLTPYTEHVEIDSLQLALSHGYMGLVKHMLKRFSLEVKLKVFKDNNPKRGATSSMLHLAVRSGSKFGIETLLGLGVDKATRDWLGCTVLHAIPRLNPQKQELALKYFTADIVNAQDHQGRTALHIAAALCSAKASERLLKSLARVDIADAKGYCPVHVVIMFFTKFEAAMETMQVLIKRGANPNSRTSEDDTVLHLLARRDLHPTNKLAMMVFLVKLCDADLALQDGRGISAQSRLRDALETWLVAGVDRSDPVLLEHDLGFPGPCRFYDVDYGLKLLSIESQMS